MSSGITQLQHWSDPKLGRALKISAGIHFFIFILLLVTGHLSPQKPREILPSLRVDLVALPDQLKNEIVEANRAKEIPEPVPQETKNQIAKPVDTSADVSLKKKKDNKTAKKNEQKMKDALTRIRALQALQQFKGNQISKGSVSNGETTESLESTYFDGVLDKVRSEWQLPKWLQERELSAKIVVTISKHGEVIRIGFQKMSGDETFDNEVKQAVLRAAPFEAPPAEIASDLATSGILLGFPL